MRKRSPLVLLSLLSVVLVTTVATYHADIGGVFGSLKNTFVQVAAEPFMPLLAELDYLVPPEPDPTPPPPPPPAPVTDSVFTSSLYTTNPVAVSPPGTAVTNMVGGSNRSLFPAVVLIRYSYNAYSKSWCSGTLTSPTTVLTAAHCVLPAVRDDPSLLYITFYHFSDSCSNCFPAQAPYYTVYVKQNGVKIFKKPPDWTNYASLDDLAELSLNVPVPLSIATPIPVGAVFPPPGASVTTVGFGATETGNVTLDQYSRQWSWSPNAPGFLCPGDSGGPLLYNQTVVGVASGGDNTRILDPGAGYYCKLLGNNIPDIYARPIEVLKGITPGVPVVGSPQALISNGKLYLAVTVDNVNLALDKISAELYTTSVATTPIATVDQADMQVYRTKFVIPIPESISQAYSTLYLVIRAVNANQRSSRIPISLTSPKTVQPFTIGLFPFAGTMSCEDSTYGGLPGMKALSCTDIGDGSNHSCSRSSLTSCLAAEGPNNQGSPGCRISCVPGEQLSGLPPVRVSLSGPTSATLSSCVPFKVSILDANDSVTGVTAQTSVKVTGQSVATTTPAKFFTNSTCTTALTNLLFVPQINGTASFWLKHPIIDSLSFSVSFVSGPILPSNTLAITVDPPIMRFVGPSAVREGLCVDFQVETVDQSSVAYKVTTAIPLDIAAGQPFSLGSSTCTNTSCLADPTNLNTTLLSTAGLFSDSACTALKNSVTIAAGATRSPSFYFKGVVSQYPYSFVAFPHPGATPLVPNTFTQKDFALTVNRPILSFASSPTLFTLGKCAPLQIARVDPNGSGKPFPSNTLVSLAVNSSPAPMSFYGTSACTTPISSVTIAGVGNTATLYIKNTGTTAHTVSITAAAPGFETNSMTKLDFVLPHLVFSPLPASLSVGKCSTGLTIQVKDSNGSAFAPNAAKPTTLRVSAGMGSATSTAYSNSTCITAVATTTIAANGTSGPALYFKPTAITTTSTPFTLKVEGDGLLPALYNVTVK